VLVRAAAGLCSTRHEAVSKNLKNASVNKKHLLLVGQSTKRSSMQQREYFKEDK
jgi:hypothetical protein